MTGRDPAIEAAQRAWHGNSDNDGGDPQIDVHDRRVWDTSEAAAREALAQIRDLYEELNQPEGGVVQPPRTDYSDGIDYVLSRLRPLIYTSEELSNE